MSLHERVITKLRKQFGQDVEHPSLDDIESYNNIPNTDIDKLKSYLKSYIDNIRQYGFTINQWIIFKKRMIDELKESDLEELIRWDALPIAFNKIQMIDVDWDYVIEQETCVVISMILENNLNVDLPTEDSLWNYI